MAIAHRVEQGDTVVAMNLPARRRIQQITLVVLLCILTAAPELRASESIRIGTTPVFLDDQVSFINAWRDYLEQHTNRRVVFVRRGSYAEIHELLQRGEIDFAWTCGYPYVRLRQQLRLLAVPVYRGKPLYQSYLIVPSTDTATQSFRDLKGKVFAYSDPNSNSGWLVPQSEMRRQGLDPARLFRKSFFTLAHRKVVEAVGSGLADGGAVDGYVWETLAQQHPEVTTRTRIVWKSDEYGFPPFVARRSVSESDFQHLQYVLLNMNRDKLGRSLLAQLNLDGFIVGGKTLFASIEANMNFVAAR